MTKKLIGEIEVSQTPDGGITVAMPTGTEIPEKKEWSKHAIWQFNGKAYKPLTQKAEDCLVAAVKDIESKGYAKATKEGKRKLTSVRYAILTTGVEPFTYIS